MATSGSIDFTVTRDDIITEALEQLGVIDVGGTPTTSQLTSCTRTLNLILKNWQADEVNLHAIQKIYMFVQKDVNEYLLGSTAVISTAINQTTLKVAGAATDTTVDMTDTTNAADDSTHILQLDDGSNDFLTQDGAVSGDTMTFNVPAGGLTSAAALGNTMYHFALAEAANRPMKIIKAVRRTKDNTDIPLEVLNLDEYTDLNTKTTDGVPVNMYYRPEVGLTRVRLWPEPSTPTDYIVMWVKRTLDDFDAADNNADYPQEWYWLLVTGLALGVHKKFGVKTSTVSHLTQEFAMAWDRVQGNDRDANVFFSPDMGP